MFNKIKQFAFRTSPATKATQSGNIVRCRLKCILILAPLLFAFCLLTLLSELELTKNLTKLLFSDNEVGLFSNHIKTYSKENTSTIRPTIYNTTLTTTYDTESRRGGLFKKGLECSQACNNSYINCSNIHEIKLGRRLGTGWTRVTFQGMFRGYLVAVKFSNYTGSSMRICYEQHKSEFSKRINRPKAINSVTKQFYNDSLSSNSRKVRQFCVDLITETSKQELYLSKTLKHPVLVNLLGYCLRNTTDFFASYDVTKRQIVSVWQFGKEATGYELPTWQLRFQQCIKLVDFLLYLEKFSLYIDDFSADHLIFSCGNYKFIDFESFKSFPKQPIEKLYMARKHMQILRDLLLEPLFNISCPSNVLDIIQPLISDIKLKPQRNLVASDWMSVLNKIKKYI